MKKIKPSEAAQELRVLADFMASLNDQEHQVILGMVRISKTEKDNTSVNVNMLVVREPQNV